jgi:hypothetical protein
MRLDRLPARLGVLITCLLVGTAALGTSLPGVLVVTGAAGPAQGIGSLGDSLGTLPQSTIGPLSDASPVPAASPVPVATLIPPPSSSPVPTPTPNPKPAVVRAPARVTQPSKPRAPAPEPKKTTSNQRIVQFPLSGSQSSFEALMKDMSVDVIDMAPGTYHGWHLEFSINRTARPLTIRPARGTVIFDGTGSSSHEGLITAGWSGYTAHIAFTGPFQINNYTIGQTGLIITDWASYLTFNGFSVRGTKAPSTNGQTAWAVYISSDGTHHGSHLTFDYWNVDSSASGHKVSGMQLYHTPQAAGVTALHWTVTGGFWGFVGRGNATGVTIEYWTIKNCTVSFDSNGPAGIVKYVHASSSGGPTIRSPMVNGGGNTW